MDTSTEELSNVIDSTGLVPIQVLDFFLILNLFWGEVVGIFGLAANLLNIIIFSKQGYDDSVNVTLTALALSDIGALITLQAYNLMVNPWFLRAELPVVAIDLAGISAFYPHNYFIRVCGFITAFSALERCCCVLLPLKVKRLFTNKATLIINIAIFIVTLLDVFPIYFVAFLDWAFYPDVNKTLLGMTFREDPNPIFSVSYFITDLFAPYFTFFVIITCTSLTVLTLKRRAAWRKDVTSVKHHTTTGMTRKDTKLVLMLSAVSCMFIACLVPQSAILTALTFVPGIGVHEPYFDVSLVCYSICYVMETVSSSANVLVYYKMSSRYRETLHGLMAPDK
ncbi:uncharacterized protein LOC131950399 [Physella acuta]|uniref:uncharacterized protein LOC131950399 n=1 Tax=Physella acuta TaxID=109671 RepID=UPI0027DCE6F0|nr:uncharacterized protein LOC131950399 [Physella acuta]